MDEEINEILEFLDYKLDISWMSEEHKASLLNRLRERKKRTEENMAISLRNQEEEPEENDTGNYSNITLPGGPFSYTCGGGWRNIRSTKPFS